MSQWISLCTLLCVASVGSTDVVEGWQMVTENWYVVRIGGATAGVLQSTILSNPSQGLHKSTEKMKVTINRGEDQVKMTFITEMEEDDTGAVQVAGYTQQMAEDVVKMTYTFEDDEVKVKSEQAGKVHESTAKAMSYAHVGRVGAKRLFIENMEAKSTVYKYATIKPELGSDLVNITSTFKGASELDVGLGMTAVQQWDTTIDGMAMKVSEWCDEAGTVLQMHIESGTGLIEAVLSSELKAEAEAAAETKAPELVDSTNVHLEKPVGELHAWRGFRKAHFIVTAKSGEVAEELPSSGYQRVTARKEGGLDIKVDLALGSDATEAEINDVEYVEVRTVNQCIVVFPPTENLLENADGVLRRISVLSGWQCNADARYIDAGIVSQASAMVDGSDEAVMDIARKVLGRLHRAPDGNRDTKTIVERAYKLRQAVKNHITVFDLATGYASASETARRASGDCSEHAVLLAAVLRSDSIPSRVCSGLVYTERQVSAEELNKGATGSKQRECDQGGCEATETDAKMRYSAPGLRGSFAWHAWTQALVNGKWIDVDATLHHAPYSVGHVLMGTSSLSDRTGHADEMKLVSLVGNLAMKVVSVDH